jgi:hypothetical protein
MARGYRWLSAADEDEIWARLRAGHAAKPTARALGLSTGGVRAYLVRCGGIRPAQRRRSPGRLSLVEREEISRGLAAGLSLRMIAAGLRRAPSTISREVAAHGGRDRYRAAPADQQAWPERGDGRRASWQFIRRCVRWWPRSSSRSSGHLSRSRAG